MKSIFVFCAVLGAAYAGSRDLDASASLPRLRDYERLCASGQVPESGALVTLEGVQTWVYCKQSRNNKVIERDQQESFNVGGVPQTVFLKPGDVQLKQKVTVTGNVKGGKTRIYYVPSDVNTDVDIKVNTNTEKPEKPSVVFLSKGDGNSGGRSGNSGRRTRPRDDSSLSGFGDLE